MNINLGVYKGKVYRVNRFGNRTVLSALTSGNDIPSSEGQAGGAAFDMSFPDDNMGSSSTPAEDLGGFGGDNMSSNPEDDTAIVIDPEEESKLDEFIIPIKSEYEPLLNGIKVINTDSNFGVSIPTSDKEKALGTFVLLTGYAPSKQRVVNDKYEFFGLGDIEYLPRSIFKNLDEIQQVVARSKDFVIPKQVHSHKSVLGKLYLSENEELDMNSLAAGITTGAALMAGSDGDHVRDFDTTDLPDMEMSMGDNMEPLDGIEESSQPVINAEYIVEVSFYAGVSSVLSMATISFGKKKLPQAQYDDIVSWINGLDESAQMMLLGVGTGEGCVITGDSFDVSVKAEVQAPMGKIILTFRDPAELPESEDSDLPPLTEASKKNKYFKEMSARVKKSNNLVQRAMGDGITKGNIHLDRSSFPMLYDIPLYAYGHVLDFSKEPLKLLSDSKLKYDMSGYDNADYMQFIISNYPAFPGFARELGTLGGIASYFLGYMDRMGLLVPSSGLTYPEWFGFYYPNNDEYHIGIIVRHRVRVLLEDMMGDIISGRRNLDKYVITDYIFFQSDANTIKCVPIVYSFDEEPYLKADPNGQGVNDLSELQHLKYLNHRDTSLDISTIQNIPRQSMWKVIDRFCRSLCGQELSVIQDRSKNGFMDNYEMVLSKRDSKRPSELAEEGKRSNSSPNACPRYDLKGIIPKRGKIDPASEAEGKRKTSGAKAIGAITGLVVGLVSAWNSYKESDAKIKEIIKSKQKPIKRGWVHDI